MTPFFRAFQRVGEPTDKQLREVLERAPWMLDSYSNTQWDRAKQLRDAIERRVRSLGLKGHPL